MEKTKESERGKKRIYKMLCVHLGAFTCFDVYFNQFLKKTTTEIEKKLKKITSIKRALLLLVKILVNQHLKDKIEKEKKISVKCV